MGGIVEESLYLEKPRAYIEVVDGKIVLRAHNVEHKIWERKLLNEKNLLRAWYLHSMVSRLKRYEVEVLKKADLILTITGNDAHIIKRLGINTETFVVPFGIDVETTRNLPFSDLNLEFIGALDWLPNEEGLLWFLDNVWKHYENKGNIMFFVAGRNASHSLAEKLKNTEGVVYLGEVDDAQDFITSHGIFVVPLLTGSGMRVKIIEAMSLGRLVITTSVGIEGIDAVPGVHYILADYPEDWKNAIDEFTGNKEMAKKIAKNGQELVAEKYNNELIYKQLMQKLFELIGE
jgi:glycosyltransferase involved in cell wall biosynthesis